jgi:hypothetical protein
MERERRWVSVGTNFARKGDNKEKMCKRLSRCITAVILVASLLTRPPVNAGLERPEGLLTECSAYFGDDLVLVSAFDSYLYKATDKGWRKLSTPMQWVLPAVTPDRTIYLWNPWVPEFYRSSDRGQTWSLVGRFPNEWGISFYFYPSPVPDVFFVAGPQSIYRSTDGGATWVRVLDYGTGDGLQVVFSPNFAQDGIAFATASGYHAALGVWKTTDGGTSWRLVLGGTAALAGYFIAVSPQFSQDGTVFASADGVYKSTNGGESWSRLSGVPWMPFIPVLSPDYIQDQTVFIWGSGNYLSQDGGKSWQIIDPRPNTAICGGGFRRSGPFEPLPIPTPSGPHNIYLPFVTNYTRPLSELWVIGYTATFTQYVLRSRDYGSTWEEIPVFEASYWLYLPVVSRTAASN